MVEHILPMGADNGDTEMLFLRLRVLNFAFSNVKNWPGRSIIVHIILLLNF